MPNMIMFGLGIASAVVVIFIIAMVVVIVRLNKKCKSMDGQIRGMEEHTIPDLVHVIDQRAESDRRDFDKTVDEFDRKITGHYTLGLEGAKSYTDSRIDKTIASHVDSCQFGKTGTASIKTN